MSTRKSTPNTLIVQGTKADNATSMDAGTGVQLNAPSSTSASSTSSSSPTITTPTPKNLDTKSTAASSPTLSLTSSTVLGKQDIVAAAPNESHRLEKSEINTENKPFQQRVTRNSPLLLPLPITIKKEPLDNSETNNSESEDNHSHSGRKQTNRGRKPKETKEQEDIEKKEDNHDSKSKYSLILSFFKRDTDKSSSDTADSKDQKDSTSIKDSANPTSNITSTASVQPTSNRLTRKSTASQESLTTSNTRVTRQRQSSGSTITTRSETPPGRGRHRNSNRAKMPQSMTEPAITAASKRKRSADSEVDNVRQTSSDEPGPKYIKIEVKDTDLDAEESIETSQTTSDKTEEKTAVENIQIKQEVMEESELETITSEGGVEKEDIGSKENPSSAPTSASTIVRGKQRYTRKSNALMVTSNPSNISPSTRSTRQTKAISPAETLSSLEPKKRRMGSQTRSLHKTSQSTISKATPVHPDEEEDSKDSTASSTNTDDIALAHIKTEKNTVDIDEFMNEDKKEDNTPVDSTDIKKITVESGEEKETCSDLPKALTVNIEAEDKSGAEKTLASPANILSPSGASTSPSVASSTEKAASLSPSELVSEGVSEISVKQFYKKPKFLENNLGIEEDPKLGNIVQEVVGKTSTLTVTKPVSSDVAEKSYVEPLLEESFSNESMKEGTLRFEDSLDDKKSVCQEDTNSMSSDDKLTRLVVDEDDADTADKSDQTEKNTLLELELQVNEALNADEKLELKISENENASDENVLLSDENVPNIEGEKKIVNNAEEEEPEEDELTIEESETISMDNNASVNNDATNEIEEDVDHEEDLATDIRNLTPIEAETLEDKIDSELSAPLQVTEDSQSSEVNLVIDTEEPKESVNVVLTSDEDNVSVLAKIDAELKKIDERHREKLIANKLTVASETPKKEEMKSEQTNEILKSNVIATVMDVDKASEDIIKVPIDIKKSTVLDELIGSSSLKVEEEQASLQLLEKKLNYDAKFEKDDTKTENSIMDEEKKKIETEIDTEGSVATASTPLAKKEEMNLAVTNAHIENSPQSVKDDDVNSENSGQSNNSWVTLDFDNDDEESLKKKEMHFQTLGLVTHKAAEKRRLEVIQSSAAAVEANKTSQQQTSKRNGKNSSNAASTHHEYTGTLKTIIKLNRNSTGSSASGGNGRKTNASGTSSSSIAGKEQHPRRQSLKMTFQKGRGRAYGANTTDRYPNDREGHGEDHYYTIQNETEDPHDHQSLVATKKDEKEKILIPEKASSFKFHPGRLCEDQCYYCSGKFGLYDTPCHVGQIKSIERQQKILANEEKLTVDNCLCDACFRHVDRRANVPSYKKRLSAPGSLESANGLKSSDNQDDDQTEMEVNTEHYASAASHHCLVTGCSAPAAHSLRRKCIRKSVKKFLVKFEVPTTVACIWLCRSHYDTIIQSSGCLLCKRRLGKNHMYHITSDTDRLEKSLAEMGIPVQLGVGTAVCKLCRYFANLLMKPLDSSKSQKAEFVKNYKKRLLQFHNINDNSNDASEAEDDDINDVSNDMQQKTKQVVQNKQLTAQEDETSSHQKDHLSASNSPHSTDNELSDQPKTSAATKALHNAADNMDRDFLTDSSNSSVSNTASHSPNEMSKLKAILQSNTNSERKGGSSGSSSDISNVLRANPNISMRELFPGEEDLGLNFEAPFGSSASQRTPEGWTRVQTFLQYDEPTRRLWEELQKPYGNQSSFLRHLILLEKYFRNGDLVLSASASNNASVYTQTVRQRLTSYDKGHCGGLQTASVPKDQSKTKEPNTPTIPTYEINEDDEDDDDVTITQVETPSKSSQSLMDLIASSPDRQQQRTRSLSVDKLTKQLCSNAVTITARPKDASSSKRATPSPQKSLLKDNHTASTSSTAANLAAANAAAAVALAASTAAAGQSAANAGNSRSILKCNLMAINKSVEIVPINNSSSSTSTSQTNLSSKSSNISNNPPQPPPLPLPLPLPPPPAVESKQQKILEVANKLLGNKLEAASKNLLSSPPELVSLPRRPSGLASLPTTTTITPTPTSSASNANSSNNNNNNGNKRPQLLTKPGSSKPTPNYVILPDTLTPQERLQTKSWRPTLMQVQENQNLMLKNGPLYKTADGRILPSLVQVQSGGKPFLISIFDYNRMCILRREKLMRDQMLKATKKRQEAKQQTQQQQHQQQQHQPQQHHQQQQHQQQQHQPQQHHQQQQQQQQHHQPQQQQQQQQHHQQQHHQQQQFAQQQQHLQNKNIQNMNKSYASATAVANQRQQQQQQQQQQQHQQQQHAAQQQLLQMQLLQHQQALLKAAAAASNNSSNSQASNRFQSIAPKPPATNTNVNTNMPALQASMNTNNNFSAPMMPLLANAINNAANTGNVNSASNSINNASWLWNNFPDANQLLLNGSTGGVHGASGSGGVNNTNTMQKLPQLLTKPNLPNNPASVNANSYIMKQHQQQQQQLLLSKVPKSLIVIPQHKLMNTASAASGNVGGNSAKE